MIFKTEYPLKEFLARIPETDKLLKLEDERVINIYGFALLEKFDCLDLFKANLPKCMIIKGSIDGHLVLKFKSDKNDLLSEAKSAMVEKGCNKEGSNIEVGLEDAILTVYMPATELYNIVADCSLFKSLNEFVENPENRQPLEQALAAYGLENSEKFSKFYAQKQTPKREEAGQHLPVNRGDLEPKQSIENILDDSIDTQPNKLPKDKEDHLVKKINLEKPKKPDDQRIYDEIQGHESNSDTNSQGYELPPFNEHVNDNFEITDESHILLNQEESLHQGNINCEIINNIDNNLAPSNPITLNDFQIKQLNKIYQAIDNLENYAQGIKGEEGNKAITLAIKLKQLVQNYQKEPKNDTRDSIYQTINETKFNFRHDSKLHILANILFGLIGGFLVQLARKFFFNKSFDIFFKEKTTRQELADKIKDLTKNL